MRRLAILLMAFLAAPLAAQTGDCAAESGTSTTWAWSEVEATRGKLTFFWHAAGLADRSETVFREFFAAGTDLTALADSKCVSRDADREAIEFFKATMLVARNPDAELVQPAYPEVCPVAPATPSEPIATEIENCRKAAFHQYLVRQVWPFDAQVLRDGFWDVWDWVDTQQQSGFNTVEKQLWLGLSGTQWTNAVNPRMNNMAAFVSSFDEDAQWIGDLDDIP